MSRHPLRKALPICLLLALSACGGGGGGGGGSAPGAAVSSSSSSSSAAGFTLSGSIGLPDTAAVDSDTNDPDQAGWSSNNTATTAQALNTPVQLIGTLNLANTGPAGRTYSSGDIFDAFAVSLSAGQVIELEFAGDVSSTDMDLALYDKDTLATVGASYSASSLHECILVSRSGDYYVVPMAYKGAALYTLRIGSPGENTRCGNSSTSTELFVSGQLIAKARAGKQGLFGSLAGYFGASPTPPRAELLQVPAGAMRPDARRPEGLATASQDSDPFWRSQGTLRHMKDLLASGDYAYVEPNYRLQTFASYTPDDPSYLPQRWHYEQISLPSAMDRILALSSTPSVRPIVAVIDTGIVSNHPDLQTQIVGGYSFISSTSLGDGNSASYDEPSSRSYCQSASCWHGTHVAGTIAAISDNQQYGAGVASMARLMPLRVFQNGNTTSYDVSQAILYASGLSNNSSTLPTRRADVINLSLGGAGSCPSLFADTIGQARNQGVIVVAASGNSATAVSAPANCAGVIAVGALDALKQQTSYSNYGASLDLMAPGGDLSQSTTGTGYPDGVYSTYASYSGNTRVAGFAGASGTSMAAPHVAGVIALMRYVNPAITPAQIDTLIAQGKLSDDLGSSGRDDATGYGLINARKAVDEALTLASGSGTLEGVVVASPSSLSFGSNLTSLTLNLGTTAASSETVSSIVASSPAIGISAGSNVNAGTRLGDYVVTVDRNQLGVGTHYPTLSVTTSSGRSFSVQLTVVKLASGSNAQASFGSVWVQASDAASGTVLARRRFTVSGGRYQWSLSGIPAGQINLIASTDLDNDALLCEAGEACGSYSAQTLTVGASQSGLDFAIAPSLANGTSGTP